ncbi:MAG: hypothetical protein C0616_01550 [Desulfuromonas sp.]|nr:MAG: hypothetical protein C0616_01550 [Desulfuromonas sp.]
MAQRVFLVHGWSVQETTTYQTLHRKLAQYGDFAPEEVFLGRYVSLDDRVEIRDLAKALHAALKEKLAGDWETPFHIITHSTGALVVRHWVARHYSGPCSVGRPLHNVVFLAGPHFGSRLAHHGRSMLAHIRYLGETGNQVLKALELGSEYSWLLADAWLDPSSSLDPGSQLDNVSWRDKGIRPICLVGDRVKKSLVDKMAARVMPAGFEKGSDMVVRVASANLNFRRYRLMAHNHQITELGRIDSVPFAAFEDFVHSGPECGIMNSIKKRTDRANHLPLGTILESLAVEDDAGYDAIRSRCSEQTARTRESRPGFAQLDFRFRDDEGHPVTDYAFVHGFIDEQGDAQPSSAVVHVHKNIVDPHHLTVFLKMDEINHSRRYFIDLRADSGTPLFKFDDLHVDARGNGATFRELVREDETTQIDVVLSRAPHENLFVFHRGDDSGLHVKWDRKGEVVENELVEK